MSEPSDKWGPVPNPLPSDSRLRKDLRALADGDLVEAQVIPLLYSVLACLTLNSSCLAGKSWVSSSR